MAEVQIPSAWVAPAGDGHWSKAVGRQMVEAWRHSGESRSGFAKRHGLGVHRVKYWIDRVDGTAERPRYRGRQRRQREVTFAPVRLVDPRPECVAESAALEVVIGAAVVRVPPGFDEAHLRRVVLALDGGA